MAPPLLSMAEAIRRFVPDGATVALALTGRSSWPAAREIIRQRRRDLTLVAARADMALDPLIGAGAVRTLIAAEMGDGKGAAGPAFRRAVEAREPHEIELRDHSALTLALALLAGSLGVPFIPTYTALGSELSSTNTDLVERINPLNERGEPLLLVRALAPDIAFVHVRAAAPDGSAWLPTPHGLAREGARAARQLLVVAEEIVERDAIPPAERLAPPPTVSALVHAPAEGWDESDYLRAAASRDGFEAWLERAIYEGSAP